VPDSAPRWKLDKFGERLDSWIERENPSPDLRYIVTEWVFSRYDDPYQGVRREAGFANLWFGTVPRSDHGEGAVVVCSYWIEEHSKTVRCDIIASLNRPI
jgi:hypothetical protein